MGRPAADNCAVEVARLYDEHIDAVFGYVARRLGADVARDVVADVFEIAVRDFDRYDSSRGPSRAWLFGIATNLIRREWRTEQRRLRAWARHGGRRPIPGDALIEVDDRLDAATEVSVVMAAVSELDSEDRDLLLLIAWEHCSYVECAAILSIRVGTVRSRLNRIRRRLRTTVEANRSTGVVTGEPA